MRRAFIEALCELGKKDECIWLLTGDLGFSVLESFSERFPDRFVNVGVAEQNMMGIAAGLALCDKMVFTYAIANFPPFRCLEQIRNAIAYHRLNVKIVSVGGGLVYGPQGYTHHGLEDIAVLRVLPNMTVIVPGDPVESRLATLSFANLPGPCYLRLEGKGAPVVHEKEPEFKIGRALVMRQGTDIAFLCTGGILRTVLEAADILAAESVSASVLSIHTVKPIDEDAILSAATKIGCVMTVEEHSVIGGLGSAVAEVLARSNLAKVAFYQHGIKEITCGIGKQRYLRERVGLTPEGIAEKARNLMNTKQQRFAH